MNKMEEKLINSRIVFVNGEINDELANNVVASLLYLDSINNEDISLYINSPGGIVNQGFAIIDTMNLIKSDVRTYCLGQAFSMASIILACGKKGKRYILPNAEVMIHQPSGGAYGKSDDVLIRTNCLTKCKEKLVNVLSKTTKKTKKEIIKYFNSDYYMDSNMAKEFGIVDKIIKSN